MTVCPSRERLAQFLTNQLSLSEEDRLAEHINSCAACIETLEQLSAVVYRATQEIQSPVGTDVSDTLIMKEDGEASLNRRSMNTSGLSGAELGKLRGLIPPNPAAHPKANDRDQSSLPQVPGYLIEAELGRGGMGVVYRARQSQLNRPVALKMILNSQFASQEQIVRFLTEAQTCAALRHPGIVHIYEVGQHDGIPFFSMELLEDGTLADYVARQPVSPREAAALIDDLARAIHAAHVHGVVHRDLKPANILLQHVDSSSSRIGHRTPPGGSAARTQASPLAPKITDFGLARRFDLDTGLTRNRSPARHARLHGT